MTAIAFSMNGRPKGKGRHNFDTRGAFPRAYTPAETAKYEKSIKAIATEKMAGRKPLEGPLSLSLRFRLPIPDSAPKYRKAAMASGEIAATVKPDWDNAAKAICDAMNKVVYLDDVQITRAFVTKIYAETPGVDVRVEAFAPQGAST